jgi:hypothetical protein
VYTKDGAAAEIMRLHNESGRKIKTHPKAETVRGREYIEVIQGSAIYRFTFHSVLLSIVCVVLFFLESRSLLEKKIN